MRAGPFFFGAGISTVYQDLGAGHFDERDRNLIQRRAVRSLERLAYRVSLEGHRLMS